MARAPRNPARRTAAVERARGRRVDAAARRLVRVEWFIRQCVTKLNMAAHTRVRVATDLIRNQVVLNISRPVTKSIGPRGGIVVTDRSKPGEYPKADTTLLMKTIFGEVRQTKPDVWEGFVGTPLDYGLILEISPRLDRSFLRKTLREEYGKVFAILTGGGSTDGGTLEMMT